MIGKLNRTVKLNKYIYCRQTDELQKNEEGVGKISKK
jgi:hypothetical protein